MLSTVPTDSSEWAYSYQVIDIVDKRSLAEIDGHLRIWTLHAYRGIHIDVFEVAKGVSYPCQYSFDIQEKTTLTLMDPILSEKRASGHEVDAAAYHVSGGERRAVFLPYHLTTKRIAIIPMPAPTLGFPSR